MQEFCYNLHEAFDTDDDIRLIAYTWGGSQRWLPLVLIYLTISVFYRMLSDDIDTIHVTDGVLSPLGALTRHIFGVRTVLTLYGLDITVGNRLYQQTVVPTFSHHDRVACISKATAEKAIDSGVSEDRIVIIPPGVHPDAYRDEAITRGDVAAMLQDEAGITASLDDATLLLSVGRLVKRKGFQWFAAKVMPRLPDDHHYLICGTGPMHEDIADAIEANNLEGRVHLLGYTSESLLSGLYNVSDALIMPNIPVEGDMEGFGIVALEAASCGTPVVASDMEGMRDSVMDGETGVRVEPENLDAFRSGIEEVGKLDRNAVRQHIQDKYSWEQQAERYKHVLRGA